MGTYACYEEPCSGEFDSRTIGSRCSDCYRSDVSGRQPDTERLAERVRRQAARDAIVAYHEEQLLVLLDHVREGFRRLDAREIDAFELDDVIFRYKRSAAELWKFCDSTGSQFERAVSALAYLREAGEEPDWWERGAIRGRG